MKRVSTNGFPMHRTQRGGSRLPIAPMEVGSE
jgi:hypothetical protein